MMLDKVWQAKIVKIYFATHQPVIIAFLEGSIMFCEPSSAVSGKFFLDRSTNGLISAMPMTSCANTVAFRRAGGKMHLWLCLAFVVLFCSVTPVIRAATHYVSLNGTNNSPYLNWPDAATNIQWAVNASTNGDTVWISNGTYVLTNYITVSSNIMINGVAGDTVVVDGNTSNRCFYVPKDVHVVLSNLFITRGYGTNSDSLSGSGGGVHVKGSIEAYNCIFSNNFASIVNVPVVYPSGGGMYIKCESTLSCTNILRRCDFINNKAYWGGGLRIAAAFNTLIDNCLFHTNYSPTFAGGLLNSFDSYSLMITGCYFTCNYVGSSATDIAGGVRLERGVITHSTIASNFGGAGGGIQLLFTNALITNCIISDNSGNQGGGIYLYQGSEAKNCSILRNISRSLDASLYGGAGIYSTTGTIQNCIIEDNISGNFGGGVLFQGGTLRNCLIRNNVAPMGAGLRRFGSGIISGCTIVSNYASSASTGGGGIYDDTTTSTGNFDNCIIYFNGCATAAYSNYYISGALTSYTNCCIAPALSGSAATYSTNNITANPQFINSAAGNYRLEANSPCENTGVNRDWMTNAVDLDGRTRIRYGTVDIGAYEKLYDGAVFRIR